MYNIESLGTEYTVANPDGSIIKLIQIIPHEEILAAALGKFVDCTSTLSAYLSESITRLEGTGNIDPTRVLWYATEEEGIVLSEIIEYALNNDYDKIIIEQLEPIV